MATISMTKPQQHFKYVDGSIDLSDRSMLGLGLFLTYPDATLALEKLIQSGYLTHQLSFLAKCNNCYNPLPGNSADNLSGQLPTTTAGSSNVDLTPAGASPAPSDRLADLAGLVSYPGMVTLPEIGPVIVGGRLSSLISPANDFNHTMAKTLGALGLPERSAALYSDRIKRGDHLIGIEGSSPDILQAKQILRHCRIIHWQTYRVQASHPSKNNV